MKEQKPLRDHLVSRELPLAMVLLQQIVPVHTTEGMPHMAIFLKIIIIIKHHISLSLISW